MTLRTHRHKIALDTLRRYQESRGPWKPYTGSLFDHLPPGYQQQAYQRWRAEWLSACLSHMPDPDYTNGAVLTAQVDVDRMLPRR